MLNSRFPAVIPDFLIFIITCILFFLNLNFFPFRLAHYRFSFVASVNVMVLSIHGAISCFLVFNINLILFIFLTLKF
jgi:hypothetical protein